MDSKDDLPPDEVIDEDKTELIKILHIQPFGFSHLCVVVGEPISERKIPTLIER